MHDVQNMKNILNSMKSPKLGNCQFLYVSKMAYSTVLIYGVELYVST